MKLDPGGYIPVGTAGDSSPRSHAASTESGGGGGWENLGSWFWDEEFWLSSSVSNVTWNALRPGTVSIIGRSAGHTDTESEPASSSYPEFRDLKAALLMALVFACVRMSVKRYLISPAFYRLSGEAPPPASPPASLRSWLVFPGYDKHTIFSDAAWNCLILTWALIAGVWVLWGKPWLWDVRRCWEGYPAHPVSLDLWWYTIALFGYYLCDTVVMLYRRNVSDTIHHVCTLVAFLACWTMNFLRFFSLVLLLHYSTDWCLQFGRACKTLGLKKVRDRILLVTVVPRIVTRLVLFPWLLLVVFKDVIPVMSVIMQVLGYASAGILGFHLYWMVVILKTIYRGFWVGEGCVGVGDEGKKRLGVVTSVIGRLFESDFHTTRREEIPGIPRGSQGTGGGRWIV
ncbi:unnamed protein product [Darwinula stevensoni]|uniref:TLC domain-containing protein n=1 Tax=Darwinula stevensoni TaxID=69355 RepID=A0A7R9AC13_9CRUS|nr:unnamed protein product [Darwinula stevensoni]CAG0899972.1 unnamed protein product [Darwinula stevensoni]